MAQGNLSAALPLAAVPVLIPYLVWGLAKGPLSGPLSPLSGLLSDQLQTLVDFLRSMYIICYVYY